MTPEQRFSATVRKAILGAGGDVVQLLDAGVPGPSDIIIEWYTRRGDYRASWVEIKVDAPLRPEQRWFLRDRYARFGNAFLVRQDLKAHKVFLWRGCDVPLFSGMPNRAQALWEGGRFNAAQALLHMAACKHTCAESRTVF